MRVDVFEMRLRVMFIAGFAVLGWVAAACGSASATGAPGASPTQASDYGPVTTATRIALANNAKLGHILVDGSGRTLYLFAADKGADSACYAGCAAAWPPVLTTGAPQAGSGVDPSLLGTSRRKDGSTEVTYAGHPLYYFVADKKPGDTTGQGVNGFGAPWYALSPSGMQVGA
jgi:predicted lipoprotein with Yx(FWY)xxD motif